MFNLIQPKLTTENPPFSTTHTQLLHRCTCYPTHPAYTLPNTMLATFTHNSCYVHMRHLLHSLATLATFTCYTRYDPRYSCHHLATYPLLLDLNAATLQMKQQVRQLQSTFAQQPMPGAQRSGKSSSRSSSGPYPSTSPRKQRAIANDANAANAANTTNTDFHRSFREGDQPQLPRCHRCLGRDKHEVRRCPRTKLWDSKRDVLCNWNAKQYLKISKGTHKGLELCAEWQRPNGCTERGHPEKHRCSGCASTAHGAEGCPEGQ